MLAATSFLGYFSRSLGPGRRGPRERGCVGSDLKFIMLLLERNYVTGGLEPQIKKKDYELNGLYLYENDGHQKFVTLIIKCR